MIKKARISDIKTIHKLVNYYAKRNEMLPRSINELYENIRDFFIAEMNGKFAGCCALHIAWDDLAEIKSLAVPTEYLGKGVGKKLVTECLKEAKKLGIKRVFALTYKEKFFEKFGFARIRKEELPHKIWSECINCPMFPDCEEIPMIKKL